MFDQQDKTQNMNTNKDKDGDKDIESCTGCPRKNTLIKFLDQRSCSSPARRHCGQDSAAASRNGAQRRRSPQPARLLCLRAGEEHDL